MKININCFMGNILPKGAKETDKASDFGCGACEYIKENEIHRCSNFLGITGKDPQNGEQYIDEWKCGASWAALLQVENSMTNRSAAAATESLRNEMVSGNQKLLHVAVMSAQNLPLVSVADKVKEIENQPGN